MRSSAQKERAASHMLTVGTLARFADGLSWFRILDMTSGHQSEWWRCAIADAEHRGLLAWDRVEKAWRLTEAGRAAVRGVN